MNDQTHVTLLCADTDQRMHVQELGGNRGHLIGGHHPGAQAEQQDHPGGPRGEAQPPKRDRLHATRGIQHHVHCLRMANRIAAVAGVRFACLLRLEAGLNVRAQLLLVVGQTQQVQRCHRARVQTRMTDRQAV
jgi:hypothetical protein